MFINVSLVGSSNSNDFVAAQDNSQKLTIVACCFTPTIQHIIILRCLIKANAEDLDTKTAFYVIIPVLDAHGKISRELFLVNSWNHKVKFSIVDINGVEGESLQSAHNGDIHNA